jgi:hypothetical protein
MFKKCVWCGSSGLLTKEHCFDCFKMKTVHSLGTAIEFKEYEVLSTDIDRIDCLGWALKDTLYLFGESTILAS